MPIVDAQKEREIVQRGIAEGKSQEFIKTAILRFREIAKPPRELTSFEKSNAKAVQTPVDDSNTALGFAKNFGKAFVSNIAGSEVGLGQTIAKTKSGQTENYANLIDQTSKTQADLLKLIRKNKTEGKDTSKLEGLYAEGNKQLQELGGNLAEETTLPTTGQAIGQLGGTVLDTLTAGTYGKATLGMKSGQLAPKLARPSIIPATGKKFFSGTTAKEALGLGSVGYLSDITGGLQGFRGEDRMGGKSTIPGLGTAISTAIPTVGALPGLKPQSSNIMQRVARISKSKQEKFKQTAGESVGEYLTNRGIFGDVENITKKLFERFNLSKGSADDALSRLPGKYRPTPVKTALGELFEREKRVSSPGALSPDFPRVRELQNKFNKDGLSMSEINEAKRLYERNVKLDYLRGNLPEKVARANTIDSAVRNWQFNQADRLGLKNLPDINKETRLAKQLMDDLGKEHAGKAGNNAITLTDWIMLSGGDPTAISAFLAKKTISSEKFMSGTARLFSPKKTVGLPTAKFGVPKQDITTLGTNRSNLPQVRLSQKELKKAYEQSIPRNTYLGQGIREAKEIGTKIGQYAKDYIKNPKMGLSIEDVTKDMKAYKGEKDLTTKILKDLEGKTTVSKQYILDATNRGELKQVERDITRQVLDTMPDGQINVKEFADKVKSELLPLKTATQINPRYENISLPSEIRGNVKNYSENVYESPIKTSAGKTHFPSYSNSSKRAGTDSSQNYFGHTRIEDMADNKTRRVIEVQSDLYQKGNLEKEIPSYVNAEDYLPADKMKEYTRIEKRLTDLTFADNSSSYTKEIKQLQAEREALQASAKDAEQKVLNARKSEVSKLQQYNDPTAHFRMVREEIKKAAQDGKTKLQFPTGETAMKIEGLGQNNHSWQIGDNTILDSNRLKQGLEVNKGENDKWIITDVLGDGKFRAMPKEHFDSFAESKGVTDLSGQDLISYAEQHGTPNFWGSKETFDISGKVDTNNPIYKFYEKEVAKYLNKFGGKKVVDDKGVSWIEVPITKEQGKLPVEAFGIAGLGLLGGYTKLGDKSKKNERGN